MRNNHKGVGTGGLRGMAPPPYAFPRQSHNIITENWDRNFFYRFKPPPPYQFVSVVNGPESKYNRFVGY